MKNNGILLLCLLLVPVQALAASPTWQVSPNICVTKHLGDECKMQVEIVINDIPPGEYCLYQEQKLVHCFSASLEKQKIALSFSENMQLNLVSHAGNTIPSTKFHC